MGDCSTNLEVSEFHACFGQPVATPHPVAMYLPLQFPWGVRGRLGEGTFTLSIFILHRNGSFSDFGRISALVHGNNGIVLQMH